MGAAVSYLPWETWKDLQRVGFGLAVEGERDTSEGGGKLLVGSSGHHEQAVHVGHIGDGNGAQLHARYHARVVRVCGVGDGVLGKRHVFQRHVSD